MNNFYTYIIGAFASFFIPIYPLMIAVFVMIAIDAIIAIAVAIKMEEEITSKKLKKTLIKMLIYELLIIATRVIETTIFVGSNITVIAATACLLYEFYSVGEKFKKYTGIPILDYLKKFLVKKLDEPKDKEKEDNN